MSVRRPSKLHLELRTAGELPSLQAIERWLTERGEPFELHDEALGLRALPLTVALPDPHHLRTEVELRCDTPVARTVDLVFDLSVLAGADVSIEGDDVTRASLWLRLADEQDRLKIAAALDLARERGCADDVLRRLWAVLNSLYPQGDVRWSAELNAVVRLDEGGAPTGVVLGDPDLDAATLVPRRVSGAPHLLAWRWLSEAWPSLVET